MTTQGIFIVVPEAVRLFQKLMNVLENFRRRWRWNRYLRGVRDQLARIQRRQDDLDQDILSMRSQRCLIYDNDLADLRNRYLQEITFLQATNLFVFVDRHQGSLDETLLATFKDFTDLNAHFLSLRDSFMERLNDLEVLQDEVNREIQRHEKLVADFHTDLAELQQHYIANSEGQQLLSRYESVFQFFRTGSGSPDESVSQFLDQYGHLIEKIVTWNEQFLDRAMDAYQAYFDDIDGKSLDQQQRRAVLTDEDANLVLAGAGSGKTLTISGKVKYLVEHRRVNPQDILLISFTDKASKEMKARIADRLHMDVPVYTFHNLGLQIISKVKGKKPEIYDRPADILASYMKQEIYLKYSWCDRGGAKELSSARFYGDLTIHPKSEVIA